MKAVQSGRGNDICRLIVIIVISIAVVAAAEAVAGNLIPSTDSAFGVYTSHTLPQRFMQAEGLTEQAMFDWCDQHMAALGAHWTRYSLLAAWQLIEPTLGGGYNWNASGPNGAPDTILGAVYAPGNDIHAVINIQALSLGTVAPTRSPFINPTEYRAFVQALAERYDGDGVDDAPGSIKVNYFQLANEVQDWFDRGLTPDQYGEAAQITLEALRAANPSAQLVMMGGFSRGGTEVTLEDRYKQAIQAMISRGVRPAAIDIHWWFWSAGGPAWQSPVILDARAYLDSLGLQDVQVWSMEDGAWTGCPANQPSVTEEEQALTLVKRYVWGRANGIDKLFWQELLDGYNFNGKADSVFNSMGLIDDGEQNCSDITRRNTQRIAYWSYQKLATSTDNLVATPSGTVTGVHDGSSVFAYQYLRKSDSSLIYIVWREGNSGNVTLDVPGSRYRMTGLIPDRFGNFQVSDLVSVSGNIAFSAGSQPLLIEPVGEMTCSNPSVKATGSATSYYSSVQSAFSSVTDQDALVMLQAQDFNEDVIFNRGKPVALHGGYDCDFAGESGTSTITGSLIIMNGTLTIHNLVLGPDDLRRPLLITFDLHADPMPQVKTVEERRAIYSEWIDNANWLLDSIEPYGAKISFLSTGEFLEFCLEDTDRENTCFPLIRRLYASGGMLGTHTHLEYHRGTHDWPDFIKPVSEADTVRNWDDTKHMVDEVIRQALGIADSAAVSEINSTRGSHIPESTTAFGSMMTSYGYTIREGGNDQELVKYFGHVPFNPYRPGTCNLCEDLSTLWLNIPQSTVIGQEGEHYGIWQDGSAARKQAEILQALVNMRLQYLSGGGDKVWQYGWGVHNSDLSSGSAGRAAVSALIPWIASELLPSGSARFASYPETRDAYAAWAVLHPGASSFSYSETATDYSQYPYSEWTNQYLRFARLDSRIASSGADLFLMKAGDYSVADPTTYSFVLASSQGPSVTVDLSPVLGAGSLRSVSLSDGSIADVSAVSVSLSSEPVILCSAADCDAILASGVTCGAVICNSGQVCASDVNICVPDCRNTGFVCPDIHPSCDASSGVCR